MILVKPKFCPKCRKEKARANFQRYWDKRWKIYRLHSYCKECRCSQTRVWRTGAGKEAVAEQRRLRSAEIKFHCQRRLCSYRKRSKFLGLEFDLTVPYLMSLYLQQGRRCYYTGEEMIVGNTLGKSRRNSLSLDRLDSTRGYVQGNVVWCINTVNVMKQEMSEREFYDFMAGILARRSERKVV